jgi:hypothetical protein
VLFSRLSGRHALFPPRGEEEKKSKRGAVHQGKHTPTRDPWRDLAGYGTVEAECFLAGFYVSSVAKLSSHNAGRAGTEESNTVAV